MKNTLSIRRISLTFSPVWDRAQITSPFLAGPFARRLRCSLLTDPLAGYARRSRLAGGQHSCAIKGEVICAWFLLAFALLLGIGYAHSEGRNTVVSHGKSVELKRTFEGTPTSYTRRSTDAFSVGYYIKDGAIVKENSLLADEDRPVSKLDLEVVANGEGFNSALESVTGKGKPTVIDAVWGFMNHGSATVNLLDGTIVNAEEAVFLSKAGGASFIVDHAVLNPASGIILQMMDNDDRTVGGSMKAFNTEFKEAAGWPSENGNATKKGAASAGGPGGPPGGGGPGRGFGGPGGFGGGPGGFGGPPPGPPPGGESGGPPSGPPPDGGFGGPPPDNGGGPPDLPPGGGGPGGSGAVKLFLTNGSYKGNVFNGSGYYNQRGGPLEVSIGKAATLDGAISLTETRHIDETGKQNTHFTINEYYYLGHVANRNYGNGTSTIEVNLKDGGKWTVTGEGLISKLVVENGTVEGANGAKVVMRIDGKETAIKKGETYSGNIVVLPVNQSDDGRKNGN
jgi:hypothetical protein